MNKQFGIAAAFAATVALSGVAHASGVFTFDDVTGWSADRKAPAGFASTPSGGAVPGASGNNVLGLTLSAGDHTADLFYDTQGEGHALTAGTQYLSVQLYVTQDMINNSNRVTGLWGQAADPNNTPIIELAAGQFRGWDGSGGGSWTNLGAPSAANQWYTLAINHDTGGGLFDYYVNGVLLESVSDNGAASLANVILEGENGLVPGTVSSTDAGSGTTATYYYDNLVFAAAAPTPLPAALPMFGSALGLAGGYFGWRKRTKAVKA